MTNSSNLQQSSNKPISINEERLREKFKVFVQSLGDVLTDITALEVNTMIVAQITGSKFIPEEAYRYIFAIPQDETDTRYFQQHDIPEAMYPRYRSLRKKLLTEYQRLLQNPNTDVADPQERLPSPDDPRDEAKLREVLDDPTFLRGLRKIVELKAALDSRDEYEQATDIIYAQTVMQLDGDIINRYHQKLLDHEYKDLLINIHSEGVVSGEKQWRGLLGFMVDMVQTILQRRNNSSLLPPFDGQN